MIPHSVYAQFSWFEEDIGVKSSFLTDLFAFLI